MIMRRNTNQESVKTKINKWFLQYPKLQKFISNSGYFIKNPEKLNEKLNELYNSATNAAEKQTLIEFGLKIQTLYRMIKMSLNGQYKGIPKGQLLFGLTGFLYLVSPTDLVPDFIPFLGFADDAAF